MSYTKEGMPYQGHSTTSQAAAVSQAKRAPTKREIVYYALRSHDGMTDEELQDFLKMNPSTERPRRVELVQMRLVVDSGITRKTRGGENAVVWRVKTPDELVAEPALSKPEDTRCPTCGHKL